MERQWRYFHRSSDFSLGFRNSELSLANVFTVYRKDRPGIGGVRVIAAIRNDISSSVISVNSRLEMLCVTIYRAQLSDMRVVGACNRPLNCLADFVEGLTEVVDELQCKFPNSSLILAGDFNYLGIDWSARAVTDECEKKKSVASCLIWLNILTCNK